MHTKFSKLAVGLLIITIPSIIFGLGIRDEDSVAPVLNKSDAQALLSMLTTGGALPAEIDKRVVASLVKVLTPPVLPKACTARCTCTDRDTNRTREFDFTDYRDNLDANCQYRCDVAIGNATFAVSNIQCN